MTDTQKLTRKDKVLALYNQHFNCCQVVFAAYGPNDKLDEETALKLSSIFGGGVACSGTALCGALMGGLMAISMRYGFTDAKDYSAQAKAYEIGRAFMIDFKSKIGSCICEEILGINIGTQDNLKKAQSLKLFETKCLKAVNLAADLLEGIL
jgi:C_GCAxxG_C_C family probable redox protein